MKKWLKRLGLFLVPCVIAQSMVLFPGVTAGAIQALQMQPLSRSGWVASASASSGSTQPGNAIDENSGTLWQSGKAMQNGDYFMVDMGTAYDFNTLTLLQVSTDHPGGYDILVSNNGTDWTTALANIAGITTIQQVDFPQQHARYVKLLITGGGNGSSWWSIADLKLYQKTGTSPHAGWTASSSNNEKYNNNTVDKAIDDNLSTFWTSGTAQHVGEWFQVDMGGTKTFNTITLSCGNGTDYAGSYDILVSSDGQSWSVPVGTAAGRRGEVSAYLTQAQTARYVRIVVASVISSSWWNICNIEITFQQNTFAFQNISLNKTTYTSYVEPAQPGNTGAMAVDGNDSTRWSTGDPAQPGWITIDLGATYDITGVRLKWENAYASAYKLQVSSDNSTFTDIETGAATGPGVQNITVSGSGRYIRMNATAMASQYGVSLYDFTVYGASNLALGKSGFAGQSDSNAAFSAITNMTDGSATTRWSTGNGSNKPDVNGWVTIDLGVSTNVTAVHFIWENAYAYRYQILLSNDNQSFWQENDAMSGTYGEQTVPVTGRARYVRVKATIFGSPYGFSLYEFGVYGMNAAPATFTTNIGAGNTLNASVQNTAAGNTYQMWVYQKLPADVTGQATNQYIWVPMTSGANNTFSLAGATADESGNYRVAMIETDPAGNVVTKSYDVPVTTPTNAVRIEKILVDGRASTGRETVNLDDSAQATQNIQIVADSATGYTLTYGVGDNKTSISPDASGNTFPVSFTGLGAGIYTFTATAIGNAGQKDTRTLTFTVYVAAGTGAATPVISGMTGGFIANNLGLTLTGADTQGNALKNGDGFLYRFRAGEPGRGISYSASSVSGPTGSVPVPAGKYGTYQVYATAAYGTKVSYDDAAMGYYDYTRPGGAVTVSSYTVKENGGAESSATGQSGTTGKNYAFNATADVSKLTGGETARYSFWRCDASGWVLLKDWSPDATLSWTPAYAGKYIIQVRVQGSKAGSYESARNMTFDVSSATGLVTAKNVSLALTVTGNKARQPVTLTTVATPSAGLLYRYEVQDPTLGLTLLNAYSPDNTFTWVPRKAGSYTVYVQVINQNSFGMYDAQTSQPVTVG